VLSPHSGHTAGEEVARAHSVESAAGVACAVVALGLNASSDSHVKAGEAVISTDS
jgi:hypothetical protein